MNTIITIFGNILHTIEDGALEDRRGLGAISMCQHLLLHKENFLFYNMYVELVSLIINFHLFVVADHPARLVLREVEHLIEAYIHEPVQHDVVATDEIIGRYR